VRKDTSLTPGSTLDPEFFFIRMSIQFLLSYNLLLTDCCRACDWVIKRKIEKKSEMKIQFLLSYTFWNQGYNLGQVQLY
jgi:hypothetical protein